MSTSSNRTTTRSFRRSRRRRFPIAIVLLPLGTTFLLTAFVAAQQDEIPPSQRPSEWREQRIKELLRQATENQLLREEEDEAAGRTTPDPEDPMTPAEKVQFRKDRDAWRETFKKLSSEDKVKAIRDPEQRKYLQRSKSEKQKQREKFKQEKHASEEKERQELLERKRKFLLGEEL